MTTKYCCHSFGCHAADGDMAPGSCVTNRNGGEGGVPGISTFWHLFIGSFGSWIIAVCHFVMMGIHSPGHCVDVAHLGEVLMCHITGLSVVFVGCGWCGW